MLSRLAAGLGGGSVNESFQVAAAGGRGMPLERARVAAFGTSAVQWRSGLWLSDAAPLKSRRESLGKGGAGLLHSRQARWAPVVVAAVMAASGGTGVKDGPYSRSAV